MQPPKSSSAAKSNGSKTVKAVQTIKDTKVDKAAAKAAMDKEFHRLALKVNNALRFGFRTHLIMNNLAVFGEVKTGLAPLVMNHVDNKDGVYKYGPDAEGDFKVSATDIVRRLNSSHKFGKFATVDNFKNVSVRIRPGTGQRKRKQINIHPSFDATITVDNVQRKVRVYHGLVFLH